MSLVAIIGTGPAALMAADVLSSAGVAVHMFEKRPGPARKLFIAGGSGLNISHSLEFADFIAQYSGPRRFWELVLRQFPPTAWLDFIAAMGLKTFVGTSGRYFVETMHAAQLIRLWRKRLTNQGVSWHFSHECVDFEPNPTGSGWRLTFINKEASPRRFSVDGACFGLGGGSYEPDEIPLRWPLMFKRKALGFTEFHAANAGYQVVWSSAFLREAEGLPLKNIRLTTRQGQRLGDCVVTSYGLEGTPIYAVGCTGIAALDLKPDLTHAQIVGKLQQVKENLSPMRRVKRQLHLCPAALALLFHEKATHDLEDENLDQIATLIKHFPLRLVATQPLSEAISASGGLQLSELDDWLMLKKFPGLFAAGEMLDWDAPTGGFLIQACVSQGYVAGQGLCDWLKQGGR